MKMTQKKTLLGTYYCFFVFLLERAPPSPSITRSKIIKSLPTVSEEEQQNIQVETLIKILIRQDSQY